MDARSQMFGILSAFAVLCWLSPPAVAQTYDRLHVTFPYAGATLHAGEEVGITWTGGDPDWTDMVIGLVELTPGFPYAVVALAARESPNRYYVHYTIPARIDYASHHYDTAGHTFQFTVYRHDYSASAYGPRFTVGEPAGCQK
jgi:hypothetical protein